MLAHHIIKAKSLPNLLTNLECWKKNVVVGVRERFCWIHFQCALGAKISKTQGRHSVDLTHKLYLTKLLHSAWGQTSLRSVILDMWCFHTCG